MWWTRDVAQRLVGRHLTKPHSEQWMDEVGYARKCGTWHTLNLPLGNLLGQKRRGLVDSEYWDCVKKMELPEIPQEFRRNVPGLIGPDDIAARGMMLEFPAGKCPVEEREQNIVLATTGHPCVSLVDFPVFATNYPVTVGGLYSSSDHFGKPHRGIC